MSPTTTLYTLSLHDALPISLESAYREAKHTTRDVGGKASTEEFADAVIAAAINSKKFPARPDRRWPEKADRDRKSTRLNSSHRCISYAVFCLKKKKIKT